MLSLNFKACFGRNVLNYFSYMTRCLTFIVLVNIGVVSPSLAAPSGCDVVNSTWSSGVTYSGGTTEFLEDLPFSAGEVINYQVTTSGNTNDYLSSPNSGGGFAIYSNSTVYTIIYEEYAGAGNELNLSSSFTIPNIPENDYTVYPWSGSSNGSTYVKISCNTPVIIVASDITNSAASFTKLIDTHTFTFTPAANAYVGTETGDGFEGLYALNYDAGDGTEITVSAPNGYTFDLNSLLMRSLISQNLELTLTFANATTQTLNYPVAIGLATQAVAANDVVSIKFVTTDYFTWNNFVITDIKPIPTNTAPTISNLNGDSVAWAGESNTVTLDVGGNGTVSDAEFGALNSGNGNWSGGSLAIQRSGTAVPFDILDFNTTGALFTASAGNLQASGLTFATYTNTGGVLTITFTSSGTAATTALVQDVLRHITYRNDTPAGDATVRFTLSDGSVSTTADVTITSDIIYITNTTDTATINLSNGVSFSEAVAIAAADVTGSQTLIFTNSFNNVVSLAGNLSINESLTLNADAASGLIISGGTTITLGGGTTLSFTNASGTVVISSPLGGSGSLSKDGSGTLTLSSISNEANMSGGITVNAGTLQISSDDHLSSGTLTLNGGTLTNSSTAFTIDNAIALGSSGGTINVGGGSGATLLTLSGVISGTGNLTKNGQAILQLDGNNTYSGATNLMAGTIIATHSNALGTTAGATTVSSGATLRFTSGLTVAEALTISGTGKTVSSVDYGALHLVSGSSTLSGSVTLAGDANISAASGTLFASGAFIGGGNLNKTDVGSLFLSNTGTEATMSGGITVTAGVLGIDNDGQLSSGTLSLSGGALAVIGVTTIDNNIDITASSTINTSGDTTLSGVISGAHNLAKAGSATLTLAANNTYSGNTIVSAGGLTLTGGSSISDGSAVSVASGATLTLGGGSETIGSLLGDGNIVLGYNLTTGGNNASTTFSGVISGTGNGITKTGSGTFTLSGSNTYTGSTTVSAGTLGLSGGAAISDVSAVTVSSGATVSLNASETLGSLAGAGNVSLNGFTLSSGGNNTSTTFSGALGGSGGFTKTGSGTLTLSGSNSGTFTGDITISGGGTLSVASDDNLGSGTLSINNSTFGITGATTIDNSIALTNSATISNTAAATISNAISGSGSLSKAGSGVLSLSGTSNYGGSTTVLASTLSVPGALNGTSAVSVSSGATLTGSGSVTNLIVSSGGTLSPGNSPGVFTVNGNLQMNSGSTLAVEINGVTAGTDYDQLIVNGTLSLAGTLVVNHGYSAGQGDSYTIIVNDMADLITGTFSGLAEGATITAGGNGSVLTASYIGGTGNDFTLTAPNNAAPVIANLDGDSVNFIEGSPQVLLDAGNDATVTDSDSTDFDGGNVTVSISANRVSTEDVLSIRNQGTSGGQIGTSGLNVTYGGVIIGTRTANGGTDTHDLVITLNSAATPAIIQALVRNLIYINTNTIEPDIATRTVRVTVNDGDGGTSSNANIAVAVTAVDAPPVITGSPLLSVNPGVAYSFTPTVSDTDSSSFVFSITNKPAWAAFDTTTGALTGTPTGADVGTTTGIVIGVNDGTTTTNLPAFNLTVVGPNNAPTIVGTPATSVNQNTAYSFTPTGNDVDAGTTLNYSITNKPAWANFDAATGALTGIPTSADVGTTSGIVISVSDGAASVSLPAFNLTVVKVNQAPTIVGTPVTSVNQDVAYHFTPVGNDTDAGTVLVYSVINKPVWAVFDTATGTLSGTPTKADIGTTAGIIISVSDGIATASLPVFAIEVLSTTNPLAPVLLVPANIELNATGLYTPVPLRQLIGLNPTASQTELDQALADLASDITSGNACCAARPAGLNAEGNLLLPPGRHEIVWTAANAAGLSVSEIQTVDVKPLVSMSKSQIAIRGSTVEFRVILNGRSPTYPLAIPYVIDSSSTATGSEYNLVNGIANFAEAGQLEVAIPVQLNALNGMSDSQLVVRLDGDINAGVSNRHTISIREGNVPPAVVLQLNQGGVHTTQITPTGGPVTITATVTDLNPGNTHSYDWSASDTALGDTDGNPVNNTLVFDPSSLSGRHQAQLTVTDSGGASATMQLYFRVVQSLPVLSADVDTDGDGIDDLTEGYGDTSGNGIPDYLDNMPSSNVLPQLGNVTNAYLIECDPGVRCGLGQFALGSGSGGVQILSGELGQIDGVGIDKTFKPVGGIFDFVIRDLPTPGQNVRIVIPQKAAIPANAVYRKYQKGTWVSFIENANNTISSTQGNPGYCPPPGNPDWTPGLTAGHLCVQLTIEDGGPNDDDGLVNSAIADPGAVSVALPVVEPPEPPEPKPPVEIKSKGGGAMGGFWVLLLGGLMMLKRLNPIGLAVIALAVTSANVQAKGDKGFYLRADISNVASTQEEEDFTSGVSAAGHDFVLNRYDENRAGYHLALGHQWDSNHYTELGYLDLGDVKVDLTVAGDTDLNAFSRDFAANYPLSAEGLTLVQGVVLTPNSLFKVSAEVGVFVWRSEIGIANGVFAIDDDKGTDPLVGLKFELPLTDRIGLGLGLRRIYFDEQEADLFSFTSSFRF